MPCGFVGDSMLVVEFTLRCSPAISFGMLRDSSSSNSGGLGVPNMALLKARAANTGAGVSGGSTSSIIC